MDDDSEKLVWPMVVPVFALPNVVLLPRAVLPLHIFEPRYKEMMADALAGSRQIAMALLKSGWERDYYQRPAVESAVCVGTILSYERLSDGCYNFLLQGHTRAHIVQELEHQPYRVAQVEPMEQPRIMEIDLDGVRQRLAWLFTEGRWGQTRMGRQFRRVLASHIPTAAVVDLVAFMLLEDVPVKQALLAEPDARNRAERTLAALEAITPVASISIGGPAGELGMN